MSSSSSSIIGDLSKPEKPRYALINGAETKRSIHGLVQIRRLEQRRTMLALLYSCVLLLVIIIGSYSEIKKTDVRKQRSIEVHQPLPEKPVNFAVLKQVERATKRLFIGGSWRYLSSEIKHNGVHIYIQVPNELASEKALLSHYIKSSLCPKPKHQVWQLVNPWQVKLNLLTWTKSTVVIEHCA